MKTLQLFASNLQNIQTQKLLEAPSYECLGWLELFIKLWLNESTLQKFLTQ